MRKRDENGFLHTLSEKEWANASSDDEEMRLFDGTKDLETSVADFNQDQECSGSRIYAEVTYA